MSRHRSFVILPLLCAAAALGACSGPADPSQQGVTLRGALEGGPAAIVAFGGAADPIVVTVLENPSITTTVGPDGSFTLRGLPEGSFTLAFTQGATTLGTIRFDEVKPNQEITIKVSVRADGTIVILEEKRNGIGHGDIEIEGLVEALLGADPADATATLFRIDGYTVVAKPGQTAVRKGNQRLTIEDVKVGQRVHVKGSWLEAQNGGPQFVLALEIKIQEDSADSDDDDTSETCMISGGKVGRRIELEGNVASGTADAFELRVNGNRAKGLVDVDGSAASFTCNGNRGLPADQCKAKVTSGAKVHVRGTLDACDPSSAEVSATEVKVQK